MHRIDCSEVVCQVGKITEESWSGREASEMKKGSECWEATFVKKEGIARRLLGERRYRAAMEQKEERVRAQPPGHGSPAVQAD